MFATELSVTEQLTPYLPLLGTLLGGLIIGGFAMWNRRKGNVETKAPSVAEIWARSDRLERRARAAFRILDAFRGYVARVRAGGDTDLNAVEQTAHDIDLDAISKE